MGLETIDIIIFIAYCLLILGIGLWVSRDKKGHEKNAEDYFLASKSLPWWAIGASLIAANISAEQFIGMSGSAFASGLAIASYEWMAAITLLIVGKFFLPIFIKKGLYTIPEFVEQRFSTNLKTILAVFWIALFVFVNLSSVLYLGATALDTILGGGGDYMMPSILGLALFAAAYSLYGGLSAVAWTDVVQVVLLIAGGLITTFIALDHVAEAYVSPEGGVIDGMKYLYHAIPEKFSMILEKGEITKPNGEDAWWDLPGLAVIVGGMWVANIYYWGFNQYIIQRTLAAKSLKESQKGIAFAAFLKLIIPLIVVVPGLIAYLMNSDPTTHMVTVDSPNIDPSFVETTIVNGVEKKSIVNDAAFPWLIKTYIPMGIKGLVLAALAAAIVSSLASMLNSASTIFTMDIYLPYINKNATDKQTVSVGRITAAVALLIGIVMAPLLGGIEQAFQFIQEYTGVVSPGILAVFLTGLFWKRATNNAAIWGVLVSIPIAFYFKIGAKGWASSGIFVNIPFLQQMMWTALLSIGVILLVSHLEGKGQADPKGINLEKSLFKTSPVFNISAFVILTICAFLYAIFW